MAALFSSKTALRYATGASVLGAATVYYTSQPRIRLDSAQNAPTKLLNMPSSMLFPKQIIVREVQQVNHDTKRITFALPGGDSEVSGVPAGGETAPSICSGH